MDYDDLDDMENERYEESEPGEEKRYAVANSAADAAEKPTTSSPSDMLNVRMPDGKVWDSEKALGSAFKAPTMEKEAPYAARVTMLATVSLNALTRISISTAEKMLAEQRGMSRAKGRELRDRLAERLGRSWVTEDEVTALAVIGDGAEPDEKLWERLRDRDEGKPSTAGADRSAAAMDGLDILEERFGRLEPTRRKAPGGKP